MLPKIHVLEIAKTEYKRACRGCDNNKGSSVKDETYCFVKCSKPCFRKPKLSEFSSGNSRNRRAISFLTR